MYTHYNYEGNCAVVPNIMGAYRDMEVIFLTVMYSVLFRDE